MQSGISIICINKIKCAAGYKKELHEKFKTKRHIGEWFNLNEDDIEYLINLNYTNLP